eukprot:1396586-Pyramimonas_sp.AAC.1
MLVAHGVETLQQLLGLCQVFVKIISYDSEVAQLLLDLIRFLLKNVGVLCDRLLLLGYREQSQYTSL